MSRMRLMTGFGIALGGIGGAVAALMGAPKAAPVSGADAAPVVSVAGPKGGVEGSKGRGVEGEPAMASPSAAPSVAAAPASVVASASVAPLASAAPAAPSPPAVNTAELPSTREALLKAMMLCDQKKDFDECTRVSQALELGIAGPADPEGAKRFRKISMTHLVTQCETGSSPHACFVLAAKYRAGTELAPNPAGAAALEKRALELCRFRAAPECPPAP